MRIKARGAGWHNDGSPWDLEREIGLSARDGSHHRYQESLDNVTPADVCLGRVQAILTSHTEIKRSTPEPRRPQHAQSPTLAA